MRRVLALGVVIVCAFAAGEVAANECCQPFPVIRYLKEHKPVRKAVTVAAERTAKAVGVLLGTR
jgi:hypothetical protein